MIYKDSINVHWGEEIRKAIKQSELTQIEFARRNGLNLRTLQKWLKKPSLDIVVLMDLSNRLGVDLLSPIRIETSESSSVFSDLELQELQQLLHAQKERIAKLMKSERDNLKKLGEIQEDTLHIKLAFFSRKDEND